MNIRANLKVDKSGFYKFIAAHPEGRYEYVRGQIVQQMTGGTLRHTLVAERFRDELRRQLDATKWLVTCQGRGVETAETIRHPDVVVEPLGADMTGLATDRPAVVIEVLSPSTEQLDLNVKRAEYMNLGSLRAYIVASQDEPECAIWLRKARKGFPALPVDIKGRDRDIRIKTLDVVISLAAIYRGIGD